MKYVDSEDPDQPVHQGCLSYSVAVYSVCHSVSTFLDTLAAIFQGPVVQSIVSLTSSLRVISLTVLADSIHNILIFFAEKM